MKNARRLYGFQYGKSLVAGILVLMISLLLSSCASMPQNDAFDPETEGVIDVHVQPAYGDQSDSSYYTIASGQRILECEPFESDDFRIYTIPTDCFDTYIDNKVRNRLVRMEILDETGGRIHPVGDLKDIFTCLETLEHSFLDLKILELGGEYFPYVQLNVNLWTPCTLYHYNRETGSLNELYTWDNREIIGLHIRSLEQLCP